MALSLRFGLSVPLVIPFVCAVFLLPGFVDTVLLEEDLPSAVFAVLELFAEWVELSDTACSEVPFVTAIVSSFVISIIQLQLNLWWLKHPQQSLDLIYSCLCGVAPRKSTINVRLIYHYAKTDLINHSPDALPDV